jgi:hypothetical protein
MDHNLAAESQAVERYILGEMSPDERDAFEDHFFACASCAADVRAAAEFRANAREVLAAPNALAEERRARFAWWDPRALVPIAASLALAGIVVYQSAVRIPQLERLASASHPAASTPFALRSTTRAGGPQATRIPPGIAHFSVYFDLSGLPRGQYEAAISDSAGRDLRIVPLPAGAEQVNIQLERSQFPPGTYTITIRAPAGSSVPPPEPLPVYAFTTE